MFVHLMPGLVVRHVVNSNVGAYNLFTALGSPLHPLLINFIVGSSGRIRALNMLGFPDNTKIIMSLDGHIYGAGGNGGTGEIFENNPPDPIVAFPAGPGSAAGHAVRMDSALEVWLTVNATGKLYGGGGGGGGAGCPHTTGSHTGPGGGGGVEGGVGGSGNPPGANSTGTGVAAVPGGNGATWATAGGAGANNGGTGAAGGAAGKAISLGGATIHLVDNGDVRGAVS